MMRDPMKKETRWALLGMITAFAVCFAASSYLCLLAQQTEEVPDTYDGVISAIVGKSRIGLSSHFYRMADMYFHKGVDEKRASAFEDRFFQKLSKELSPRRIVHASGAEMQDMIPWLWLAVRLEPHNVEAYLVAAFIAGSELGQHDLAHKILTEGQWNNPKNYSLYLEDGRFYFKDKNYERAGRCLENAIAFWPGTLPMDSQEAIADKANILLYRAFTAERTGNITNAVQNLGKVLEIYPDRTFLKEHMNMLEKGTKPSDLATDKLNDMLRKNEESKATCRTDHDHAGEHEHESGHEDDIH
jgi:tetratricopeptide (TPR) repeat protein